MNDSNVRSLTLSSITLFLGGVSRGEAPPQFTTENPDFPNGLVVSESLFSLKPGKTSVVKFQVQNISNHDIVLPKRTVLGGIELVQSVTPLDVKLKENSVSSEPNRNVSVKGEIVVDEDIPSHIKQINLDGLTESQKRSALK